jgi:type I restriction enzyme S subunit
MNKVVLSSIIDIISGGTPKTSVPEYWNGPIGWLSVTDFNNDNRFVYETEKTITEKGVKESNTKFLQLGDIIISARGTVGALAQIGKPMCFNQSCFGIRGKKDKVTNDYLFYALRNYVKNIVKRSQGSVFDTINLASFDLMELNIHPDLPTQKSIAKVLSDLDAKIELNNKINRALEAMAKTLYDYWFVQFDFPDANGKPYKSSGRKMVYNAELKREIPEGWEVKKLEALTDLISRGVSPNYINSGGVCVLNQKCIRDNTVHFQFSRRHNNQKKKSSVKNLELYDVLVNSTGVGTLGRVAVVKRIPEKFVTVDSHITIVRANLQRINCLYLAFTLIYKQKEIEAFSVGSTGQVELSKSQLASIQVIVPPDNLQSQFYETYSKVLGRMSVCENENQHLTVLRDWLLPMLMNGQVTVKEAEERISMAAEPHTAYRKELKNLNQ